MPQCIHHDGRTGMGFLPNAPWLSESLICFCFYSLEKAKGSLSLSSVSPWIEKLKFSMITIHTGVMLDQNPSKRCQAHSQKGKCSLRKFYNSLAEWEQRQKSIPAALSVRTQGPLSSCERERPREAVVVPLLFLVLQRPVSLRCELEWHFSLFSHTHPLSGSCSWWYPSEL